MNAALVRGAARALQLVAALLLAGAPAAQAQVALRAGIVGGGGGSASGGGLALSGAVGQPAGGPAVGAASGVCAGFWCQGGLAVVAVGPDPGGSGSGIPLVFAFGPAVPNPTRGPTTFALALPRRATVRLEAYDVAGRRLDTALGGAMAPGRYTLRWDAARARAGVYFARLLVDGQVRARRQIVVVH